MKLKITAGIFIYIILTSSFSFSQGIIYNDFHDDYVNSFEKQGFIITRIDDSGTDKTDFGLPMFFKYGIPFDNAINTNENGFNAAMKAKYQQWMKAGFEPQDHTPYHYTVVPPRVRDPYWDEKDDGFHYMKTDSLHEYGAWKDIAYLPVKYHIPSNSEIDNGKFKAGDKVYFNLSPSIKSWVKSNCILNPSFYLDFNAINEYYSEPAGRGLSTVYDTLYFFGKYARDYISLNFKEGRDYSLSCSFQMVGFGNTEALRSLLLKYRSSIIETMGVAPSVFVHPGGYHKINFVSGRFAAANKLPDGSSVYEYAFVGDFGFSAPSNYANFNIGVDSALALQNFDNELGYNSLPDQRLLCSLSYNISHDDSFNEIKKKIANIISRHKVAVLGYHFNSTNMAKWDSVLSWIRVQKIPVVSERAAAKIIKSIDTYQYLNIIPDFTTDRNLDGLPDGWDISGTINFLKGSASDTPDRFAVMGANSILQVQDLFGVERDTVNKLEFWLKGSGNDSIQVAISEKCLINGKLQEKVTVNKKIRFTNTGWTAFSIDWTPTQLTNSIRYIRFTALSNNCQISSISNAIPKQDTGNALLLPPLPAVPVNGISSVAIPVAFKWNLPIGTSSYKLQVASDSTFTSLVVSDSALIDPFKTINGLNEGTKYFWRISSRNRKGISQYSDSFSFITLLTPPENLTYKIQGTNRVVFSWTNKSTVPVGYVIEKKTGDSFIAIDTLRRYSISYADTSYIQGTTAIYRVKAYTKDAVSDYSTPVTVQTSSQVIGPAIPSEYLLAQNFPNPFNPDTKIRYALPLESNVRIAVYNSLGQKIRDLENTSKNAGYHELVFDGRDLPSGVFYYSIDAIAINGSRQFKQVRKLLLVK